MKNITSKLFAVALLFALVPMSVNAAPVTFDGRFYEVFGANGISWDDANTAANSRVFGGVQGHLATITSAAEDVFADTLRDAALTAAVLTPATQGQVWIGGFQPDGEAEPGDGWEWVNDEGPIPGADSGDPYANWGNNFDEGDVEPNDAGGEEGEDNNENHLALGRYGLGGGWNDEGAAPASIGGYIVEFESGTVDPQDCTPCNPSGFMESNTSGINTPSGQSLTQKLLETNRGADPVCSGPFAFRDPRVNDDGEATMIMSLNVVPLGATMGGFESGDELVLDQFNYGSPCFAVLASNATFDFTAGVVQNVQLPDEVPGIGPVFGCTDTDLQQRVDFGYQTDDLNDMIEESEAAMTSGCNSPSRAGTFRFSFFVLNTHEDCGIPFDSNAAAVLQCFKDLARDKFDALHQSLKNSKKRLKKPKFGKLQSEMSDAKDKFLSDDFDGSLGHLGELLSRVEGAEFKGDFNHQGNLIMRIQNLQHRVAEIRDAST